MSAPSNPIEWEAMLGVRPSSPAFRVAIKAIYGVRLDALERELFVQLSGGVPPRAGGWLEVEVVASRRVGKTEAAARISTYECNHGGHAIALAPGQVAVVPVIAPRREQAAELVRYATGLATLPQLKSAGARVQGERVEFRSRVAVSVFAADAISVAGATAVGLVRDEWARWPHSGVNSDAEIEATLRPMLAPVAGAPPRRVFGITSAFIKRGLAYETFVENYGKRNADVLVLTGPTELWNPNIDRAWLARERKRLPRAIYDREYEGVWQDPSGAAFDGDVVSKCVDEGITERPPVEGVRYALAADVGLRRDATAIVVAHREYVWREGMPPSDAIVVDAVRVLRPGLLRRVSLDQVEAEIAQLARRYGVRQVTTDIHFADALRPRLAERGLKHVEAPMNPAAQERRSSILASRLEHGGLRLLDVRDLVEELKSASVHVAGGKVMFSAPERRGSHDDLLDALLLAAEVAVSLPAGGRDVVVVPARIRCDFGRITVTQPRTWWRRTGNGLVPLPPPRGTEEWTESQADRLARGVYIREDVEELGEEEVARRVGINVRVE